MKIDSYSMGRLTALFLPAGAEIPEQFKDRKPKPYYRNVDANADDIITNIQKQGWHVRKIELTFSEMGA